MRNIVYRPRAYYDLESLVSYMIIIFDAPHAAKKATDHIITTIEHVAELPELGKVFASPNIANTYRRI